LVDRELHFRAETGEAILVLVLLAPGQGAQTPGFLTPWLDAPGVTERLRWWGRVTDLDLIRLGTEADAETIRDTAVAQPLLVASALVAALCLFPHPADAYQLVGAAAGHSVGEIAAAAGAGVITAESALVLVRERGRAMAAAAAATPTGMTAIIGGDPDEVSAIVERFGLVAANRNGAGQIVAAGTVADLERLAQDPPPGTRLRSLPVAGAFHTPHMAGAVDALAVIAPGITVRDPRTRLISNVDGAVVHHGPEVMSRIISQVAHPVRWDLCMRTFGDLGVTGVLEMPPAGTLTGLVRRELPYVETFALKSPDDLTEAHAFVGRHGTPSPIQETPTWRVLVAPAAGTFQSGPAVVGSSLAPGAPVGSVRSRRDDHQVVAPHGGTVVEWLAEDGDPVSPGQPLIRLHPDGVPS
jgi:[acyl-carrier-protein] S-malonyltransferase